MRRILPLIIIAAIVLGACAPVVTLLNGEPETTPTAASSVAAATATPAATSVPLPTPIPSLKVSPEALKGVEVLAWHGWDGESASLFAQMATEFNGSNAWGVKVTVVSQNNLSLLAGAVDKALGTLDQPDIVVALPEQLLGWKRHLTDLTPYIVQPKIGLGQDALLSALMQQSSVDGAQVGIPALRSGRFLFYNITWAKELGFAAPPQTWDDFRKQACAANASWKLDKDQTNDGFGGLALDVDSNWQTPYAWLRALGGEVFADGKFAFDSEKNLAALKNLSELRAEGCAWLPNTESDFEPFAARKALFITGSLSDLNDQRMALSTAVSTDQWTLIAFPGEKPVVPVYGPDYAILKTDEPHQLAAWLFIQWLLKPENQVRWARRTGLLPVSDAALQLLQSDFTANPQKGAAAKLLTQAVVYPQSPQWGLANKILADGFLYMFQVFPGATPESILKQMDATVEELGK